MSLTVLDPGLHSLPVDLGRTGARALGVPLGGAADRFAFQLGNLLLGNRPDAVAVELTLKGPTLRAEVAVVAVVFGAPFVVTVDGREIAANTTFRLSPGETLRIGGTPTGCRAYLCVSGGFAVPEVLGSRSALESLRAGDVLTCHPSEGRVGRGMRWEDLMFGNIGFKQQGQFGPHPVASQPPSPSETVPFRDGGRGSKKGRGLSASGLDSPLPPSLKGTVSEGEGLGVRAKIGQHSSSPPGERRTKVRALPGPQADWFPDGGFFDRTFTVAPASNRMGVRFLGEPVPKRAGELASEPVAPGAVQVTNDGLPIVLGVDGQTVGGYPKVAHVIRADLDVLGQLRPGDAVRFVLVSMDDAEQAAVERERVLRRWRMRLELA